MVCTCGGVKAVKLADGGGLLICLDCGRGSQMSQPKPSEVFSFRAEVDRLSELGRLRKEMNRGLAQSALAEITGADIATQVIDGTYQGGQL